MRDNKEKEEKNSREILLLERKKVIYNLVLLFVAVFVVLIGVITMAWFAMNRETGTSGMGVKVQGTPYTIMTRSGSGYYKDKWETLGSNAIEWQVSAYHNLDNYVADPENITDEQEAALGLEPGDTGSLEFRVQPNTADSLTVDCVFDIKAYLERTVLDENDDPVLDDNNEPVTELVEIDNTALTGYLKAHILLFAGYENGKYTDLIADDEDMRRVLQQTYTKNGSEYTTIYWVWPMHLSELTSEDNVTIIYAPSERNAVITYIAGNKDGFFKDCSDTSQQVKDNLTALADTYDNQVYNRYNTKYDNADLEIGNNISYVMLSMTVE